MIIILFFSLAIPGVAESDYFLHVDFVCVLVGSYIVG